MEALNFPDNPHTGQIFQNWRWDGEKWTTSRTGFIDFVRPHDPLPGDVYYDGLGLNLRMPENYWLAFGPGIEAWHQDFGDQDFVRTWSFFRKEWQDHYRVLNVDVAVIPYSSTKGDVWWNTWSKELKVHDGVNWQLIGRSPIHMGSSSYLPEDLRPGDIWYRGDREQVWFVAAMNKWIPLQSGVYLESPHAPIPSELWFDGNNLKVMDASNQWRNAARPSFRVGGSAQLPGDLLPGELYLDQDRNRMWLRTGAGWEFMTVVDVGAQSNYPQASIPGQLWLNNSDGNNPTFQFFDGYYWNPLAKITPHGGPLPNHGPRFWENNDYPFALVDSLQRIRQLECWYGGNTPHQMGSWKPGALWYRPDIHNFQIWDGTNWKSINSPRIHGTQPGNPVDGDAYFNYNTNAFSIWNYHEDYGEGWWEQLLARALFTNLPLGRHSLGSLWISTSSNVLSYFAGGDWLNYKTIRIRGDTDGSIPPAGTVGEYFQWTSEEFRETGNGVVPLPAGDWDVHARLQGYSVGEGHMVAFGWQGDHLFYRPSNGAWNHFPVPTTRCNNADNAGRSFTIHHMGGDVGWTLIVSARRAR